jgi:hypothetical protein
MIDIANDCAASEMKPSPPGRHAVCREEKLLPGSMKLVPIGTLSVN